ncbi:esterase YqiA [Vibrio chagasii]|nr:esterase YqiA [Vibrio chagasii]CAH7370521.1 esterase YqiA [Vibrio chagasii]CAH7397793.1 esterase YqiA [Vibrio chagasii]CAH7399669.1 esterase YqiA [Vibrio chagasii]CAH7413880.1 esterase YqiA [Vibrio chagasii]
MSDSINQTIKPSLLLYIHGFNSSSRSHKAMVMAEYCAEHRADIKVLIPQLPSFPQQAALFLQQLVEQHKDQYQIALVGSSLGGYLSTWLNSHYGFKAVVVNPAVKPYELLVDYLGEQVNPYTDERYVLETKHIDELKALDVPDVAKPSDFWLLQQTEDEVLDYRQAVEKYQGAKQTVEEGGDHSFVDFERYPQQIITFLQL